MNKRDRKTMARQAIPAKDVKKFIPCDPALNLCSDCSKKIAEGTCPKLTAISPLSNGDDPSVSPLGKGGIKGGS